MNFDKPFVFGLAPCPKCYKYGKFRDENDCKVCVNQKYLNEECGNKVGTCKSNMECRNGKCSEYYLIFARAQLTFICSKVTLETLEKDVKYVSS